MAAGDVDAGRVQLLDTGHAAPLRVGVEAALEHDVVERVGNDGHTGPLQDLEELEGIGVVVRAHRGRVAGNDPPLHSVPHRPGGDDLQEARLLVVRLVAVEVDRGAGLAGEVEQEVDLLHAILARPLVMRYAPDDIAAETHRLPHQLLAVREGQDAVLGECDQPELDEVANLVAQFDQRSQRRQGRVADVDMRPDQAGPLGDLPQDRLAGSRLDVLMGQRRLALGPGLDPLDERPRLVVARLAHGEDGVHVDERG